MREKLSRELKAATSQLGHNPTQRRAEELEE